MIKNNLSKLKKILIEKPVTLGELASELQQSKTQCKYDMKELRKKKVNIVTEKLTLDGLDRKTIYYIPLRNITYKPTSIDTDYFALISDTHLGSKFSEEECLLDFYDKLEDAGVKEVFHGGDISDGINVYEGQLLDLKPECLNLGEMIDYVYKNFPRKKGISMKVISGNHDTKQLKKQGVDICKAVADKRRDMKWIGNSYGRIKLKEDVLLELSHPTGSSPYSKDYKLKTYLRERPINNYPDILGMGHLHTALFSEIQGTQAYMLGCWYGDTEFSRRKGYNPAIGGWIVELGIEDGNIKRIKSEWIKY